MDNKKNILITQNQLYNYSGSEIVTLELIEHFIDEGWGVTVLTHFYGGVIKEYLEQLQVEVILTTSKESAELSNKDFDIIWVHHYTLVPSLLEDLDHSNTKFIFHHMSSVHSLEAMQQPEAESQLADIVLFNSHETADYMFKNTPYAKDTNSLVFNNPAPDSFMQNNKNSDTLQKIAIISNHPPEELKEAADILITKGIEVDFIGRTENGKVKRVTPQLISAYDVIITIGKTVQYSILSGIPIFCYDWFGGPGYLNTNNIETASKLNFSGRGFNRMSSSQIAKKIVVEYEKSVSDIHSIKRDIGKEYTLSEKLYEVRKRIENQKSKKIDQNQLNQLLKHTNLMGLLTPGYSKYVNESKLFESMYVQKRDRVEELKGYVATLKRDHAELRRQHNLITGSRSYLVGRIVLLPVRLPKKVYYNVRNKLGTLKNEQALKTTIEKAYKINKNTKNKIKVDIYIRSYHHPTSSTFIRMLTPFSDDILQATTTVRLRDGEAPKFYKDTNTIVVQRTAIAHLDDAKQLVTYVQENNIKLFVDTDDAFGELDKNHPQYDFQKERVDALNYIITNTDEVWFSTEQLQKLYDVSNSKVIRNTLDSKIWPKLQSKSITPPAAKSPLRAVYMGTVTHNEDFEMIIPALDRLHQEMPGEFKLYVIGVAAKLGEKPWIEILKPYSALYPDFVAWFSKLPQFDIGLSPLVDNSFNKSKSDIKCLDYIANGIKPVVSDVTAYKNAELDEHIVRVSNTTEDWFAALKKEINNRVEYRKQMPKKAKNGFEYITKHRSTDIPAKQIKESIEEANNRSRKG
jgi:hypothetical protein